MIPPFTLKTALILCVILVSGCAHKTVFTPGQVYRDWTFRLSEMGMLPVFPPREDIVVGDIYLLPMHPGANALAGHVGGLGMSGIHVGYLSEALDWNTNPPTNHPLNLALEHYYQSRPNFPITPTTGFMGGQSDSNAAPRVGVPAVTNGPPDLRTGVFQDRIPVRLKQVAFPEFTVTTASQVGLSALIPIEGFLAGAGLNSSKVEQVSVKIPQAESYGLSSDWLLTQFVLELVRNGQSTNGTSGMFLLSTDQPAGMMTNSPLTSMSALLARAMFDQTLTRTLNERIDSPMLRSQLFREVEKSTNYLYMTLISEVFYTRALDINIQFAKGTAASASARPVTVGDLKELAAIGGGAKGATNGGGNNVTVSNQAPTLELKSGENAVDMAERLRNLNMSSKGVGGSVQVVSTGARNVGLRRVFDHPIAVGVRGVVLRFGKTAVPFTDAATGTIRLGFPLQLDTFEAQRK